MMTWTTELPTKPGFYYRRIVYSTHEEFDIVHVYEMPRHLKPLNLWMEIFGEEFSVPVSDYVKAATKYEFQPVKPPDEL